MTSVTREKKRPEIVEEVLRLFAEGAGTMHHIAAAIEQKFEVSFNRNQVAGILNRTKPEGWGFSRTRAAEARRRGTAATDAGTPAKTGRPARKRVPAPSVVAKDRIAPASVRAPEAGAIAANDPVAPAPAKQVAPLPTDQVARTPARVDDRPTFSSLDGRHLYAPPPVPESPITVLDLRERSCKYPIDTTSLVGGHLFCGCRTNSVKHPYCEYHHIVVADQKLSKARKIAA